MRNKRPKNLNLFTIRFPLPAIVSILHRVSGVALFLLIPIMLWALSQSFTEEGFANLQLWLTGDIARFIFWLLLIPFCFHLVAGIRHLLSDVHIGTTLRGGKISAVLTFVFTLLLVILAGVWLW